MLCVVYYVLCIVRNVCISLVVSTFRKVPCVVRFVLRVMHCEKCAYFRGFKHILLCAICYVLHAACYAC